MEPLEKGSVSVYAIHILNGLFCFITFFVCIQIGFLAFYHILHDYHFPFLVYFQDL